MTEPLSTPDAQSTSDTQSAQTLPPHFRCDCVPDIGPAHCHRCSRLTATPINWEDSACKDLVESFAYGALLLANDSEAALLVISNAFDVEQAQPQVATAGVNPAPAPVVHTEAAAPAAESIVATAVPAVPQAHAVPAPPKARLVSAHTRHEQTSVPGSWRFTNLARTQASALNITPRGIVALLEGPHVKVPAYTGTAINHYADGLLILVDADGKCIISVIERETPISLGGGDTPANSTRPHAAVPPKRKTHSGGAGRRIPSNSKEFISMLTEHGFVHELGGKGHPLATHPLYPGVRISVPSSPSDTRSYLNALADIKRLTGIDITKKKE